MSGAPQPTCDAVPMVNAVQALLDLANAGAVLSPNDPCIDQIRASLRLSSPNLPSHPNCRCAVTAP